MASVGIRQCARDLTPHLILLIATSTLGPLQFGFHLAELNAPQDALTCHTKKTATSWKARISGAFSKEELPALPACIPMDAAQFALVSSIFTLGGLLGALASGPISTRYGRLLAMRITSILYILGSTCETLASDIPMMIIGRLLSGVGAGASLVVVPIYISEIAPPSERGIFGVMTQITINIGLLMTQTLGYFYSKESSWRIILAAGTVIGLIQAIALFFIPESPAWTAANKDPQKALRVLQRIRGRRVDISEEIAAWDVVAPFTGAESEGLLSDPEVVGRRDSGSSKSSKPSRHIGMLEVAFDPFYRPAIIAVVGVMFAQQFCGINSVMMYSVSLLSGLFPSTSALLTIMISLVNLFMTVICAPLADKLGRKAAIIISITGMGFSSLALAFAMVFGVQILSAIAIIMFVATFAVGLGPIPFILASELVGTEARGAIQSWALSASWIATYLVAQFFPIVNTWLGGNGYVFFIFAGLALLSAIFIKLRVPETMGKKDADEVWGRVRRD